MKDKKREKVQLTMKERNYIVKSYYETKSYSQVRAFEDGWSGGKAEGSCLPKPLFMKSYFARDALLEIRFCAILQGL